MYADLPHQDALICFASYFSINKGMKRLKTLVIKYASLNAYEIRVFPHAEKTAII